MILNRSRLLDGCPPGTLQAYKLRLLGHFLLDPIGQAWDITLTSAYRSETAQAGLYALVPKKAARKAKGISQHSLGEAADFVPKGSLTDCFLWCFDNLEPWQLILEYDDTVPECIHVSIPSEHTEIQSKRLLFYNGLWMPFTGTFPNLPAGGAAA